MIVLGSAFAIKYIGILELNLPNILDLPTDCWYVFLAIPCDMWDLSSNQGWNPHCLQSKGGVLTTGLPEMFPADCTMLWQLPQKLLDFPAGIVIKNPPANAGDVRDVGSIPGLGRSPGVGNGNPLQYSYRENSMGRGAWHPAVHGVPKNWTWFWILIAPRLALLHSLIIFACLWFSQHTY